MNDCRQLEVSAVLAYCYLGCQVFGALGAGSCKWQFILIATFFSFSLYFVQVILKCDLIKFLKKFIHSKCLLLCLQNSALILVVCWPGLWNAASYAHEMHVCIARITLTNYSYITNITNIYLDSRRNLYCWFVVGSRRRISNLAATSTGWAKKAKPLLHYQ